MNQLQSRTDPTEWPADRVWPTWFDAPFTTFADLANAVPGITQVLESPRLNGVFTLRSSGRLDVSHATAMALSSLGIDEERARTLIGMRWSSREDFLTSAGLADGLRLQRLVAIRPGAWRVLAQGTCRNSRVVVEALLRAGVDRILIADAHQRDDEPWDRVGLAVAMKAPHLVRIARCVDGQVRLWEVQATTTTASIRTEVAAVSIAGAKRRMLPVVLLTTPDQQSIRHWVFPAVSAAQARQMALLQAQQALPWSVDDSWIDVQQQRLADGRWAVLVIVLQRTTLAIDLEALAHAGLELTGVQIEPCLWAGLAPTHGVWLVERETQSWVVREGIVTGCTIPGGAVLERWFVDHPVDATELDRVAVDGSDADESLTIRAAAIMVVRRQGPVFEDLLGRRDGERSSPRLLMGAAGAAVLVVVLLITLAWAWLVNEESAAAHLVAEAETYQRTASASRMSHARLALEKRTLTALHEHEQQRLQMSNRLRQILDAMPAEVRLRQVNLGTDGSMSLSCQARSLDGPVVLINVLGHAMGRILKFGSIVVQEDATTLFQITVPGLRPPAKTDKATEPQPEMEASDADL